MKKLTRMTFLAALAVISHSSQAELKPLSDGVLSNLTGQAGITIDMKNLAIDIGEINYQDEGNLYFTGISFGGAGLAQEARGQTVTEGLGMDNFAWVIDVAGASDGDALASKWGYDGVSLASGEITKVVDTGGSHGQTTPTIEDGDLVIQARLIDHSDHADFGILVDRIALGRSDLVAGDDLIGNNASGTVLASDVVISGVGGPAAIVIDASENNLNFSNSWQSDSSITFDFIATKLNMKMHNSRGNDRLIWNVSGESENVSFFHFQADIGAAADGLKFNVTDFSGDIDLTDITFGLHSAAVPIGDIYITDLAASANMVIYGH
ncbi:MAG: hypothetical protein H7A01_12085 [Hahellaceae bacterium]|nr:hypothetical protein [Hahellaceae bacterium]MCP5209942.1 hypothetical protein [Hahellaceae bacterium]